MDIQTAPMEQARAKQFGDMGTGTIILVLLAIFLFMRRNNTENGTTAQSRQGRRGLLSRQIRRLR